MPKKLHEKLVGGGTALAEGRGELVTLLPSLPRKWVVLMMPEVPVCRS